MKFPSAFSPLSALFLLTYLQPALGTGWYTLSYYMPKSDQTFIEFTADFVIPPLPDTWKSGSYYIWNGFQTPDDANVFQTVLDGRKNPWWISTGYIGQPSLPWADGFNVSQGDVVTISKFINPVNSTEWLSTLVKKGDYATNKINRYPFGEKMVFNRALFSVELHSEFWDFGPLTFTNIVMRAKTDKENWCTDPPDNYNFAMVYSVGDPQVYTNSDGTVTCRISSVNLVGPNQ